MACINYDDIASQSGGVVARLQHAVSLAVTFGAQSFQSHSVKVVCWQLPNASEHQASECFRTRTIHTSKQYRDSISSCLVRTEKIISLMLLPGLSQVAEHPCVVCLLGMVKCLCGTIAFVVLLPIAMPISLLYFGFWMPFEMYYSESKLFNSYPLMAKYARQGIPLPGQVLDKHVNDATDGDGVRTTTYFVKVKYQFNESCYMKEFVVPQEIWETAHVGSNLDVVIFPNYPRSAILFTGVQAGDPDLPPSSLPDVPTSSFPDGIIAALPIWLFVLTIMSFLPVIVASCYQGNVDCVWPAVALYGVTPVLCLTVTYWAKRWGQNGELNDLLHSAHQVLPQMGDISADVAAKKKRVSYFDFFPEAKHSPLYVVSVVVRDIGGALLLLPYNCLFSGGHFTWRTLLQWKKRVAEQQSSVAEWHLCGAIWTLIGMTAQIAIFWASFRRSVPYSKEAFAGIVTSCYLALTFLTYWMLYRTFEEEDLKQLGL
jgi:hypothetical protein